MDDWVILAPTRWKLRGAVKAVQVLMGELKLVLHPDKTFIGRISRGFDFLGYWFTPQGLGIASKSVERFAERVSLLYEQGAGENRIEEYVRRWWRWVRSGVGLLLEWGAMLPNTQPTSTGDRSFFLWGWCVTSLTHYKIGAHRKVSLGSFKIQFFV
jgi:hypothetical protein